MEALATYSLHCPYCGEAIEIVVDQTAGAQQYTEDCFVCCQPILICIDFDADEEQVIVTAIQENV